ncbi:MAG: BolA family protein [Maritimibacter sp.]
MLKEDEIRTALEAAFSPRRLEVINESRLHAGHSGDDGSGESHFRVVIEDAFFADLSRVARHRAVHKALGPLVGDIHALGLEIGG